MLDIIAAHIDPHAVDGLVLRIIEVLHDTGSVDVFGARILRAELPAGLLLRNGQHVVRIHIFIVAGEEVAHIVRDGVLLAFLGAVVPVEVLEDTRIIATGYEGGVADVVHVPDRVVRAGQEIDPGLGRLLLRRIVIDPVLQHDPAIEVDVGRLIRHCKLELVIILLGLIHGIDCVTGPLVVACYLSGDHIGLTRVDLEAVDIVLHPLQPVLHTIDHLRRGVIETILELLLIVRVREEGLARQLVVVQRTDCGEVALTHAVLDGDALPELRIRQHIPGGGFFAGHQIRVIYDAGNAPHIAGGVLAPRLTVDLVVLENLPKIRGHALDIVVFLVRRVEEVLGERLYLALADQLHEHVLGRADEVVGIA